VERAALALLADNRAVNDLVVVHRPGPAGEVLAVEDRGEAVLVGGGESKGERAGGECEEGVEFHERIRIKIEIGCMRGSAVNRNGLLCS